MPNFLALMDYLFTGLKIFIPLLIFLKWTKLFGGRINMGILITAINLLLLLTATAYLLFISLEAFVAYYQQDEYLQYALTDRILGSYWFVFAIQAFIYILFPQIMWLKKMRQITTATIIWVLLSYALDISVFFAERSTYGSPFSISKTISTLLVSTVVSGPVLIIVYFILLKQKQRLFSKQQA